MSNRDSTRPFPKEAPKDDVQDAVHQAVDVAFSIADLIGGLFLKGQGHRQQIRRSNRRKGDPSPTTDGVYLSLASNYCPQLTYQKTPPNYYAMIIPATSQLPAGQRRANGSSGPLDAQPILMAGSTAPSPCELLNYPNYTQGLFTVTEINTANADAWVPLAALTARGSLLGSTSVPLTQFVNFNLNEDGSFTLTNTDARCGYTADFTVMTDSPNQSFVVPVPVAAAQQGSVSTNTVQAPVPIGTQPIHQLNVVLNGYAGAIVPT